MGIKYLFLDMNSYFASVEQQLRPELRGRPVAVAPMLTETTCCIAASYEAKRYGIKTGTLVQDARLLCPGLEVVEARPKEYIRIHHQILRAVDTVLPIEAVLSIDELVCKLMGREQEPAEALRLGAQVKQAIYRQVGEQLRCSVGLGPNRFLAKVAAEMHKPDGLTLLRLADLPHRLYSLALRDLPGIGPGMEQRLFKHGVTTVEELYRLSVLQLSQVWGSRVHGFAWWHRLRGGRPARGPHPAAQPEPFARAAAGVPQRGRSPRRAHPAGAPGLGPSAPRRLLGRFGSPVRAFSGRRREAQVGQLYAHPTQPGHPDPSARDPRALGTKAPRAPPSRLAWPWAA
jgi:hypothetical protein